MDHSDPFAPFFTEIRAIMKDEIQRALSFNLGAQTDRLITAEEAGNLLSVSPDWIYRHARQLPFTRRIHRKMLRFSYQGIQKYIADQNKK